MLTESPELKDSAEQDFDGSKQIQREVLAHFEKVGVNIDNELWHQLIPSVRFEDLKGRVNDLEYRPDRLFAMIEKTGEVVIDQNEFAKLGPLQKQHVLLHESSHRIHWLLSGENLEEIAELEELTNQLPPQQISPYIYHLDKKFRDSPDYDRIIRQEAIAELMAQYLESDGSFRGFIEVKSWQGAGNLSEAPWAGIPEADQLMAKLKQFDSMNEDEQVEFIEENPQLSNHFHSYVNLRSIFSDDELLAEMGRVDLNDWNYELYEDDELVASLPPVPPVIPQTPVKKDLPPPQPDTFDLFWMFRKNS